MNNTPPSSVVAPNGCLARVATNGTTPAVGHTPADRSPLEVFTKRDYDVLAENYPWLDVWGTGYLGSIIKALGGIAYELAARKALQGKRKKATSASPDAVASEIKAAYTRAISASEGGERPRLFLALELSLQAPDVIYAIVAAEAPDATPVPETVKARTIEDIVALCPSLTGAEAIKVMRIAEALVGVRVRWTRYDASDEYCAGVAIDESTGVEEVAQGIKGLCRTTSADNGDGSLVAALNKRPNGSLTLCYYRDVPGACPTRVSAPETIASLYPLLSSEQLVLVGQIDALLADVPHAWNEGRGPFDIALDGRISAASIVERIKNTSPAFDGSRVPCRIVLNCHKVASGTTSLRYAVYAL